MVKTDRWFTDYCCPLHNLVILMMWSKQIIFKQPTPLMTRKDFVNSRRRLRIKIHITNLKIKNTAQKLQSQA
jgi:hypothetical protein